MSYSSEDLLTRFKETTQIGSTNQGTSDTQIYRLLTNAQVRIARLLAIHAPQTNRVPPESLATTDGGLTYQFAYYPIGHVELRDGRSGAVLLPSSDWDPNGYVVEGQTVRMPNGTARTFANGLYARYCRLPGEIDAVTQPIIHPPDLRLAIVYDAAAEWAGQGGMMDATPYVTMRQTFLWGSPTHPGEIGMIPALKSQYYGQGAASQQQDRWWVGQGYV